MCSVFSLAVEIGWHLAAFSGLMDNSVGDPATTLVAVASVMGGKTCFGW